MDLKGSLVDTHLRIHPSEKLIAFLKTIPPSDQIPYNILQIVKPGLKSTFKIYKLQDSKPVQLTRLDIEILKNIRNIYDEMHDVKLSKSEENNADIEIKENLDSSKTKEIEENLVNKKDTFENVLDKESKIKTNIEVKDSKEYCNSKEAVQENLNKTFESIMGEKETIEPKIADKIDEEKQKTSKKGLNTDDTELVNSGPFLVTSDIDWLYEYTRTRRTNGEKDIPYLHVLLEGAFIVTPENETLKRNPVLEARCVKLRAQQEAREYRKMTKSVDNVRMRFPEDSISYQMKQLNRHLIAIGQFIISIFAGFLFGFRGVEWMVGNLDFGFRLLLGVMCALVIALAEIYFLAKKLNEELCVPETVQLGGPVKFADEDSYKYKHNESGIKPHQD